jgi:Fe-S-cluster-containing hydrogenase component 2
MLPAEFWMSAGLNLPQLKILYQSDNCSNCPLTDGEKMFLNQKTEAEKVINYTIPICNSIKTIEDKWQIDHHRRKFLTSFLEEVKETNTITVKEALEVDKTLSPFEKFDWYHQQQAETRELVETADEIKNHVIDKLLNDNIIHTDKRALLFNVFEESPELQQQVTLSIPEVKESCTRCGACAILCPMDAIIMDNHSMILATNKCICCGLCEELCYEKHIQLTSKKATVLHDKFLYLVHEAVQ